MLLLSWVGLEQVLKVTIQIACKGYILVFEKQQLGNVNSVHCSRLVFGTSLVSYRNNEQFVPLQHRLVGL
jgi:hypothetical protein